MSTEHTIATSKWSGCMENEQQTQVVGIRLPRQTAIAFKMEAAVRDVRLNDLFREMWELYRRTDRGAGEEKDR